MGSIAAMAKSLKDIHRRLHPPPKPEVWLPLGVCVREEDGEYYYANEEAQAIDARCERLGIMPNVYIVSDEWNPDMDGIDV